MIKLVWSEIFLVLYVGMVPHAHSFSFPSVGNETIVLITTDMLPILTNYTPINSTAVQYTWHPSPSIIGINLDQLQGIFIDGAYAGNGSYEAQSIIVNNMDTLNETGQQIIDGLSADTVYQVCYESKWFQPNTTIVTFNFDGIYRRQCGLLRTYMADQTTLNPVPQFGTYSWKQQTTDHGTLSIVINASISAELPYDERNIIVTLGTQVQNQTFTTPSESVQFTFDGLDLKAASYPLVMNFSLLSPISSGALTATNIVTDTVTTTSYSTSMANRLVAWYFLLPVFSTMLISL